jgi:hypothetical protein
VLTAARAAMRCSFTPFLSRKEAIASNAPVDLVRAGKLDEAERAARDLLERFPYVHDGWDRLGMLRGQRRQSKRPPTATARSSPSSRAHPGDHDDDFEDKFVKRVDKLDPAD